MSFLPTQIPSPTAGSFNPLGGSSEDNESAPSLTIRQRTGARRVVTLSQRALPTITDDGVQWGRMLREQTTWYQGNPIATQQVLGSQLDNTSFRGVWSDRFIRGTVEATGFRAILWAQDVVELMQAILDEAQEVEVEWGPQLRRGLLVRFVPSYQRLQDIGWELEFKWRTVGDELVRDVETPLTPSRLTQVMNQIGEIYALGPSTVLPDVNAILVTTIAEVRGEVAKLFGILRSVERIASIPADVAGAFSAAVSSIRTELNAEMVRLAEVPTNNVAAHQNAIATLKGEQWRRDMARVLDELLATVARMDEEVRRRAEPDPTTTTVASAETTLYAVSVRFYGTPDHAGFLRRVNFLESMDVPSGTTLIIPPKPSAGIA